MKILIATIKQWNIDHAVKMAEQYKDMHDIKIVSQKQQLSIDMLEQFRPDMIFFPHWSYKIPADIYENYLCVVFHMTALPFGRGGSPLQNLIVRGIYNTKISAVRVTEEIDAGPIYMKKPFLLEGSAQEIYCGISEVIFNDMIPAFLEGGLTTVQQEGEAVYFKRRTPEQSRIPEGLSQQQIYDYIRMMDAQGYPRAYIDMGRCRMMFYHAHMENGMLRAEVEIKEEPL